MGNRGRDNSPKDSITETPNSATLIEAIKGSGQNIPNLVKLWFQRYKKDAKSAVAELDTMIFEACGAEYPVNINEYTYGDLVKFAKKGEVDDYENFEKVEFKIFKENLESFWDNWVHQFLSGPSLDHTLFEHCLDLIIGFSVSTRRPYRQVASLIGLSLVTSFITITNRGILPRETTSQLNVQMEELNRKFLESKMEDIFTRLVDERRSLDVDPNIRVSCIKSLGAWILSYPSMFLKNEFLKHIGWGLSDKDVYVRMASITALQNINDKFHDKQSLGSFTKKFSSRIFDLADDIDVDVAVLSVGVVKLLLRNQLISKDALLKFYNLPINDRPRVRRAIGPLIYDHFIAPKFNNSDSGSKGENVNSVELSMLCVLVGLLPNQNFTLTYVIHDVWDIMKAIKDWDCILSMLLDENSSISDESATNLVRILCASVKKAVGKRIVLATDNRKQNCSEAKKEITVAVTKNYPSLLRKFILDKAKVTLLFEIVLNMNLEFDSSEMQNFKNVLELMKETFLKHGDKDPLRACLKAINFCCKESRGELQDFAKTTLKELEEEVIAKLESAIGLAVGYSPTDLRRLYELQLSRYVPIDNKLYEDIVQRDFRHMEDEVVGWLLQNMHFHLAWSLHSILNADSVSDASLNSFLSKRDTLLQILVNFINLATDCNYGGKSGSDLAGRVCILLAKTWCLLKIRTFSKTALERLGYQPDADVIQKFWELCQRQLNVSDEVQDEDANKDIANGYSEETNRYAVLIAACRLITCDVVRKDYLAPAIFSHFAMHGPRVADIILELIKFFNGSADDLIYFFHEALKKVYHTLDNSGNNNISSENSFPQCKKLAAKLSGVMMRSGQNKNKPFILQLVKDGIAYAFADCPKHLSFLDAAVVSFALKLPASDISDILKDVEKKTDNVNKDEIFNFWGPYVAFVEALQKKCGTNEVNQDEIERVPPLKVSLEHWDRPPKIQNVPRNM